MLKYCIPLLLIFSVFESMGQVSGTVYNDYNTNASQDLPHEIGLAGVAITGFGADGTVYGPVSSAADGTYTLAGVNQATRVEFSWSFDWLYPSMAGATTVQFVTGSAAGIDLGVIYPKQYCPDLSTVSLATPCYVNGDAINGDESTSGDAAGFDAWLQFPYNSSGDNTGTDTHWANAKQVGALYGEAYQSSTETLFASALVRRHVGLGSINGVNTTTGGIYMVDVTGSEFTSVPWLDVNTLPGVNAGLDPRTEEGSTLPVQADQQSHDVLAFSQVARRGLGDLEISDDESTLYTINLAEKSILEIDIASKTLNQAPIVISDPGCVNGEDIPFALGYHKGELYVGSICNAINATFTGNEGDAYGDLHLYVRKLNGTSLDPVFDFALDFVREGSIWSHTNFDKANGDPGVSTWQPWVDDWADLVTRKSGGRTYGYPTPLFTDIEFDTDGSMILGVADRSGFQGGFLNYPADASSTQLWEHISAGDIYRVCMVNGSFVLEGGVGCTTTGSANDEGPNGGEYYFEDWYPGDSTSHEEISWGALALCAGTDEVAMTGFDAFNSSRSGGVHWLNNSDGTHSDGYEFWGYIDTGSPLFAKAQGLGDLELVYPPAPIEIGNRFWKDTDLDGVQDADEPGIDGVEIDLLEGSAVVGTVITSNGGEWYFNDSNVSGGLKPNTDYTIAVTSALDAGVLAGCTAYTTKDAATGGTQDIGDSDAATDGTISYRTGNVGNNHTLDIGVVTAVVSCVNPTATTSATGATCNGGTANSDATITIAAFTSGQRYQYSTGGTFGTGIPASITAIPAGGVIVNNLANAATMYTVRIYDATDDACFVDRVVSIEEVICTIPCSTPNCGNVTVIKQ